ncbi:MAG TPA: peptide ABC transporter ATP-binding protein [Clostridiaceae bacterium]|jgi:oligopeptide transport system ATP-binding protein|nr:peptide ABC transporter ATP-binding protein [Clostridiaceae bacterium]HBG38753.1 peptide ABC transporter ATP-binding protein [Clostridiaceae bacterium]HBN27833.1 peptide ABC transporter ATP-binding protein [Clostridiaceae bacterium]HBX47484.1 peptide ABC transporter ATP-binding protein [Clostridiaceae bacterium]HCL50784.1 peptide ABC transporter ATP-binding protein [Clostridiaceae bacterium]
MGENKKLIEINNLKKYFPIKKGILNKTTSLVKAVDSVSFTINKGETLGLVGESGCGKTTCGRTIIKLYEPTDGQIIYDGVDIAKLSNKEMVPYRKKMQMIFQDPYASLDSRMTVGDIVGEAIDIHKLMSGKERSERIHYLLERVGLNSEHANRYPHEFSGGQRQRIGIARALAVQPEFIICDEPISALDVSIQAQVVNMLEDLQSDFGLTYLFIAHDLSMVKHISNKVGVMYLGVMMEVAESNELYTHPMHPYTQALLSAIPVPDPKITRGKKRIVLEGEIPSPIDPPPGCRFKGRCKFAKPICSEITPELKDIGSGHFVACHLY